MKILEEKEEVVDYIIRLRAKSGNEVLVSANIHLLQGLRRSNFRKWKDL